MFDNNSMRSHRVRALAPRCSAPLPYLLTMSCSFHRVYGRTDVRTCAKQGCLPPVFRHETASRPARPTHAWKSLEETCIHASNAVPPFFAVGQPLLFGSNRALLNTPVGRFDHRPYVAYENAYPWATRLLRRPRSYIACRINVIRQSTHTHIYHGAVMSLRVSAVP